MLGLGRVTRDRVLAATSRSHDHQEPDMATSLRFYVSQITQRATGGNAPEGGEVILAPAYKDGKNSDWAKYTPSGSITLNVNGPAFPWFQEHLGKDVHIVIDDVPED
jgi:hypothetical protein